MKFNNFALPKEVREGWGCAGGASHPKGLNAPQSPPPIPQPCPPSSPRSFQAFYMIRFHSFYPWHAHGDYKHLCNEEDLRMLPWVKELKCVVMLMVGRGEKVLLTPLPPPLTPILPIVHPQQVRSVHQAGGAARREGAAGVLPGPD